MDVNIPLWTALSMFALPVGVGILLIAIIVIDIVEGRKTKKQMARFKELYSMCIEKHGLDFAQKLYNACREPWIGIENVLKVFEHHCYIKSAP